MKRDYVDFQERSTPLAYLITIRCYGTWLHGDERGSVDRVEFNKYGLPKIPENPVLRAFRKKLMVTEPVKLNTRQRTAVKTAIKQFCDYRKLKLFSLNIRTNHVHFVIAAGDKADKLMGAVKSYATRALRESNLFSPSSKVWSRHGSTKYLWTEDHISAACEYVATGQGRELPSFD